MIAENDSSLKRRTRFTYNDTARTITTQSDQTTWDDRALKSETLYDGLGRTFETHQYESATAYITTRQVFDGLGRVSRSSILIERQAMASPTQGTMR